MLKRLLYNKINSITIAAIFVAASSLISRLLGIFRDRILAGEFGAGDTLDIYYAAFRIPDLVFNLLVLGALSAGFIPLFTALIKDEKETSKNEEAWKFTNNILNILAFGLIALSLAMIALTPPLVKLITPGFKGDKMQLTINLTRIMFLSPLFMGISSVIGGMLQSFKRFFVYSLSPIFYNIGIIIGALFFVPQWGIYGLAYGVVLGAIMHLMVQLPLVLKMGYRYRPIMEFKDKAVVQMGRLMVPRTLSLAITQINLLVVTVIASTLESGSLAIFNLANNLQSFPIGIFGISFAVAAFPALSDCAKKPSKMIEQFSATFRQILFFILPSTILLLTLRAQVVRVILGTGAFDWRSTIGTIDTLTYFMVGLFAQATIPLLVRMFYARQNSKTPFWIGLIAVLVNLALSVWLPKVRIDHQVVGPAGAMISLSEPLGVAGLSLAFSIGTIINFILLWVVLRDELGSLDEKKIVNSTLKFSLASIAAGLSIQSVKYLVVPVVDMTKTWGVIVQCGSAAAIGILVYLFFCYILKSEEMIGFWEAFKRRLPIKKLPAPDQSEARGI